MYKEINDHKSDWKSTVLRVSAENSSHPVSILGTTANSSLCAHNIIRVA